LTRLLCWVVLGSLGSSSRQDGAHRTVFSSRTGPRRRPLRNQKVCRLHQLGHRELEESQELISLSFSLSPSPCPLSRVDDPFYKYAQPSPTPVLDFSQHEYDLHLTDPEWTSHETSYLFGLLRTFDCRFVIVADRYAYPGERGEFLVGSESGGEASGSGKGKEKESRQRLVAGGGGGKKRSIEDIKSRYYSVCRRLVRSRPTGDEVGKTQMLQYYAFDRGAFLRHLSPSRLAECVLIHLCLGLPATERELARKVYASSLFDLTKEQLEEEEALYLECKRMEQQERTFRAERDELMKSLAGAATVVMAQIVSANSSSAEKKRKEAAALEGAVVGPNGLTGNKKLDKATKAGSFASFSFHTSAPEGSPSRSS
jgi:DNA methyltransferase 1-associated protein 1